MGLPFTAELKHQYEDLLSTCILSSTHTAEVDDVVNRIVSGKGAHYDDVSTATGVPWFIIGVIHQLEASGRFDEHLHNGDLLTARTVHVPAGRPPFGTPPFTWKESAIDALTFDGLAAGHDWSVGKALYRLEKFNGFGYHFLPHPINSPYLWSYSQHYSKGKFKTDGHFSATLVSKQAGTAVILKQMKDRGIIAFGEATPMKLSVNGVMTTVSIAFNGSAPEVQIRPFLGLFNIGVDEVNDTPPSITFHFADAPHTLPYRNIQGSGFVDLKAVCDILKLKIATDAPNNTLRVTS